jgi:hypothetical protein
MHAAIFYRNMHIATCNMRAVSILRCNIDNFLLNKKGLVLLSILPKKSCNMHIARRNMHIATASILRLTYTHHSGPWSGVTIRAIMNNIILDAFVEDATSWTINITLYHV